MSVILWAFLITAFLCTACVWFLMGYGVMMIVAWCMDRLDAYFEKERADFWNVN